MVCASSRRSDCRPSPSSFLHAGNAGLLGLGSLPEFCFCKKRKEAWRTAEQKFTFRFLEKIVLFLCCIIDNLFLEFPPSPLFVPCVSLRAVRLQCISDTHIPPY